MNASAAHQMALALKSGTRKPIRNLIIIIVVVTVKTIIYPKFRYLLTIKLGDIIYFSF